MMSLKGTRLRRIGIVRTLFELALVAGIVFLAATRPATGVMGREVVIIGAPTHQKVVALTYDDGPHPIYTREILDILDKYHVKATFFMVGKSMEAYPDVVREVIRRGHVIGNHTYTHPSDLKLDTQAQIVGELDRCEQVIESFTGNRAHLFRPPRGLVDGSVFTIANEEGYKTVLWTVCADHHDAPTPELMAQRVIRQNRPGGIILAHDGSFSTRWKDVAATPIIIKALRERGYKFVTVPELLRIK